MIRGLHHNAYRCRDSEETRAFYEDFLGLRMVSAFEMNEDRALHTFFEAIARVTALSDKRTSAPVDAILSMFWSLTEVVEQRLRLFEIRRIETLSEPAVDGGEQIMRFGPSALFAPQPGEACRGAQFIGLGLLAAREAQGMLEGGLRLIEPVETDERDAFGAMKLCPPPLLSRSFLGVVVRCSVSDCSAVVSPLEKRLSLSPAAAQIAGFAILLNLPNVAAHRFPSFDLASIFPGDPATKVITAIPLEPAPRVLRVDPPVLTPNRQRLTGGDAKIIEGGIVPMRRELRLRKPIAGKLICCIGHILAAEDAEAQHLFGRELRFEVRVEIFAHRFGKQIAISPLHFVIYQDNSLLRGR